MSGVAKEKRVAKIGTMGVIHAQHNILRLRHHAFIVLITRNSR
jgi:hypothetical protein